MALFLHPRTKEEIFSISGFYNFLEETVHNYGGRRLLCLIGIANVDGACCGGYGCRFILVAGYTLAEKKEVSTGQWVTEVEPITNALHRHDISAFLCNRYPHSQVSFAVFP